VPTWNVSTDAGRFTLRGKLWAWRRHITVHGGRFDGAVLTGALLDMNFELSRQGQVLAPAQAELLTLRTRHSIELLDDAPDTELLTAITMTNLMMQKDDAKKLAAASSD
jgi:uncharacterized protein YxjI